MTKTITKLFVGILAAAVADAKKPLRGLAETCEQKARLDDSNTETGKSGKRETLLSSQSARILWILPWTGWL